MSNLFNSKAFKLGFLISIFLTIGSNLAELKLVISTNCLPCQRSVGFPFRFYEDFYTLGNSGTNVLWAGLIVDLLFALGVSFMVGLFFNFVWSTIRTRRLR